MKMIMFQTMYKSRTPQNSVWEGEYYQPLLETVRSKDGARYFVRESHAWYDDERKKPVNLTKTLSPEEGMADYAEALTLFDQQIKHRADEGFVHGFYKDPFTGNDVYIYLGSDG